MDSFADLPEDLPVPADDGAGDHLSGKVVLYCYPIKGRPGVPLPQGWDAIPGARGCTPQSCAFRNHYQTLKALGVEVFGLSTQSADYQQEAKNRLHLPFELLSDAQFKLVNALKLPTFEVEGNRLIKRITLIAQDGKIIKVFYPVFPPNQNVLDVLAWLQKYGV